MKEVAATYTITQDGIDCLPGRFAVPHVDLRRAR
jgi:hypothetical protein